MDSAFVWSSVLMLVINLVYAIVAIVVAVAAIMMIDKIFYPKIDFQEEIKNGNKTVTALVCTMLLVVAVILSRTLGR